MKRTLLLVAIGYALGILAIKAHAADPVQIKVSVNYPDPPSPEVQFALFSRPDLATAIQFTPWTTNSFALVSATNQSGFFSLAVTNTLTGEMGFSERRWISLRLNLNLPVNVEKVP